MKSYAFLFWAYNVIWLGLAVYLLLLMTRLKRIQRRVEGLERVVDRRRGAADQPSSDS